MRKDVWIYNYGNNRFLPVIIVRYQACETKQTLTQ